MLNQLQFGKNGEILDKVETSIKRLQAFEPPEGYYVAEGNSAKNLNDGPHTKNCIERHLNGC